jgi:predicted nucleic acid-binding protein
LELDAYEKLRRAKRDGESFSQVVRRARFGPADASGKAILAALRETPVRVADEEAAGYRAGPGMRARPVIGDFDVLIAATALEAGLVLVSDNAAHFGRVPGLSVEAYKEDRPGSTPDADE